MLQPRKDVLREQLVLAAETIISEREMVEEKEVSLRASLELYRLRVEELESRRWWNWWRK